MITVINSILNDLNSLKLEQIYAVRRFKEASAHLTSCIDLFGRHSSKTKEARLFEKMSIRDLEKVNDQIKELLDKYEVITGSKLDIYG